MNKIDIMCIVVYVAYVIFLGIAGCVITKYDRKRPGYMRRVDNNQYANNFERRFILTVGFITMGVMFVSGVHLIYIIFRIVSQFLHVL